MPYEARFSRIFLKKYEKLPKDIKPRYHCELLRHVWIEFIVFLLGLGIL